LTGLHACNPSYAGGGDGRVKVQGHPGEEKLAKPYVENEPGVVVHGSDSSYLESGRRRIVI
jgi:hypothetical protein